MCIALDARAEQGGNGRSDSVCRSRDRGKLRRLEQATRQTIEQMEFPSNRAINKRPRDQVP